MPSPTPEEIDARHLAAAIRDIPASCVCRWRWDTRWARWRILRRVANCPREHRTLEVDGHAR